MAATSGRGAGEPGGWHDPVAAPQLGGPRDPPHCRCGVGWVQPPGPVWEGALGCSPGERASGASGPRLCKFELFFGVGGWGGVEPCRPSVLLRGLQPGKRR